MNRNVVGLRRYCLFALAVLSVSVAFAQESGGKTTLLTGLLAESQADPALERVLLETVRLQLARRKLVFSAAKLSDPLTAPAIVSLARERGAAYALIGSYRADASEVDLSLELRDASDGASVATTTAKGRIDLVLDAMVSQALDRLLEGLTLKHDAAGSGSDAPETALGNTASGVGSGTESETGPAGETTAPPTGTSGAASGARAERWRYFGVGLGAAPLVTAGPVADYAKLGVLGTLEVGVRIPARGGALELGLQSGLAGLKADGIVSSADIVLVPIGINVRYSPADGSRAGISLHLAGGGAIMRVSTPSGVPLVKTVPYALAGMSLDLRLASILGIRVEASFMAFFEASLPILAFAPEVSAYLRI